jgi:Nidogen-like
MKFHNRRLEVQHKYLILAFAALLIFPQAEAQKPIEGPITVLRDEHCNMTGASGFCIPLDGSWAVVPMSGYADPCYQNDDGSSDQINLNFLFDLFGAQYSSLWINNNGNVSFDGPYSTFSPEGFPISGFPMVAPFWGDVDTRTMEEGAGTVWMKHEANYLAVAWDHVGYFNSHPDLQNTFQLIISDGTYEPMGLGNNVCFCYGDMSWTTGDASGGSGGYGGSPATVGVNKGDGIDYFNIGRFDHPGSDYAGPDGISGVDWLDDQQFCFNVGAEFNQPPVPIDFPAGNTITVFVGETMNLPVGFIGPEADQTVHTDVVDGGLANFSYVSADGNPSTIAMEFTPTAAQIGDHVIHFTATDDFSPPGVTEVDLTITVEALSPTDKSSWGNIKNKFK